MQRDFLLLITVVSILGLCMFSSSSFSFAHAATLNNVDVNIQTSSIQADYFVVNAFNMSGYMESSVQTHYSAASFKLPSDQYIFTVTANNESNSIYPVPLLSSSGGAVSSSSYPSLPIYIAPAVEYGFSVKQISSSTSFTITTQNVSQFPTNSLAVMVQYPNGTAAVGASVSASVMGSSYYWGYEPNVVTWATTGEDGVATLIVPTAPVQINTWLWIPSNETGFSTPKVVGAPGQVVNGSVIAYPIYLGLAGSAIVVPPQTSATISLQVQPPNYWVTPYAGVATAVPGLSSSGIAAGPGSVPASVYAQQQGSPNLQSFPAPSTTSLPQPTTPQTSSTGGSIPTPNIGGNVTILVFVAVVALVVVSLVLILKSKRKKP
jgi:hypothetical protein